MGIRRQDQIVLMARGVAAVAACLALANCASSGKFAGRVDPKYGVSSSPRVVAFGEPVPKGGGVYRVGKPYTVAGRVYVPEEDVNYREDGLASWYRDDFHGRLTVTGHGTGGLGPRIRPGSSVERASDPGRGSGSGGAAL